jgi:deferrochelatase/peroxidase EfeB
MTASDDKKLTATRRGFLAGTAGLLATGAASAEPAAPAEAGRKLVPFWGRHQAGIVTPCQQHTYFVALDLTTAKRDDVVALLRGWTAAASRMTAAETAAAPVQDLQQPGADSGDVIGLPAARLTLTFGFGPGLFTKDGKDRYGLASQRPEALIDLKVFPGEQLVEARTGGDLMIQACADDPQVAFHAVRQLVRQAYDIADLRWVQSGFVADFGAKATPRNLMGFKDGTGNIPLTDAAALDKFVWVGSEGPGWMQGGSYIVARRSRIALEHWDRMKIAFQEQTVGRHKLSGAPLGKAKEFDVVDLDATDADGNPVLPENSHVRLANAGSNDGARVLRRSYSYNDGANMTAERWPPWRQAMEYDAGLLFICYQRDLRTGFAKIFERMSRFDMMNQFVTNTGGGHFACPGGAAKGEFIGQRLFDSA